MGRGRSPAHLETRARLSPTTGRAAEISHHRPQPALRKPRSQTPVRQTVGSGRTASAPGNPRQFRRAAPGFLAAAAAADRFSGFGAVLTKGDSRGAGRFLKATGRGPKSGRWRPLKPSARNGTRIAQCSSDRPTLRIVLPLERRRRSRCIRCRRDRDAAPRPRNDALHPPGG